MLKITIALTVFLLVSTSAYCQDDSLRNRLEVSAGLGHISRQDRIFSPNVHKDLSVLNAGLAFTREQNFYHKVSLRFSSFNPIASRSFRYYEDGELKSSAPHSLILVNLNYAAGKTWKSGPGELTAGLLLNADVQALNYVYGRIGSFGYFSAIGPGGFIKYNWNAGGNDRIYTFLEFPIISLYSRSPYLVNDDEFIENISSHSGVKTFMAFLGDGEWVTWNKLQYFYAGIKYEHQLSEKWGIGTSWMLDFAHSSAPRNIISFRNSLYLSSYFRF